VSASVVSLLSRPHLRARVSVASLAWTEFLTLLPAAVISIYAFGRTALGVFLLSVFTSVAAETLLRFFSDKPLQFRNGSAFLNGLLVAFLLPPDSPWWLTVTGNLFAVGVGRELFGGPGCYIFQPALLARAFLLLAFPHTASAWLIPSHFSQAALLFNAAVLAGGGVLIYLRVIPWRVPFYYLGVALLISYFFQNHRLSEILRWGLLPLAFFYLTDFPALPVTGQGRILFAVTGAFFTVGLCGQSAGPADATYGILLANAAVPILDRCLRSRVLGECVNGTGKRGRNAQKGSRVEPLSVSGRLETND